MTKHRARVSGRDWEESGQKGRGGERVRIQFFCRSDTRVSGTWQKLYPTGASLMFQEESERLGEAGSFRR